jgi:hypothetical protein
MICPSPISKELDGGEKPSNIMIYRILKFLGPNNVFLRKDMDRSRTEFPINVTTGLDSFEWTFVY